MAKLVVTKKKTSGMRDILSGKKTGAKRKVLQTP
jgi:hypothetical protein